MTSFRDFWLLFGQPIATFLTMEFATLGRLLNSLISSPRLLGPPVVTREWISARHVEGHLISLNAHRGPSIKHRGGSLEEL